MRFPFFLKLFVVVTAAITMMVMVVVTAAITMMVMVVVTAAITIMVMMMCGMSNGLIATFLEYHTNFVYNQYFLFQRSCFVYGLCNHIHYSCTSNMGGNAPMSVCMAIFLVCTGNVSK